VGDRRACEDYLKVDAPPHCGASAASRLRVALATPASAVATPDAALALTWAVMSETAVWSLAIADFTASVWA